MKKNGFQMAWASVHDIFNTKDEEAKGRLIILSSNLLVAFYNVFITGIFYTGFLTMYGISITGAGIVTFIPFIASVFSVFSSKVLGRFKRRKPILIASKIYFYGMYIIATNIMPQFVTDPDARLFWFVVILFLAYSINAPFSPGFTRWFYNFYPQDNEKRTRFLTLLQMFSSVMSSAVLLISGFITDAVANSPIQNQLVLGLRYFAFALVLLEIFFQSRAKEYPYTDNSNIRLSEVFTLPFRYKKFLLCMLMMFSWNYISNLNNGLWSYHLLNHMNFPYTLINAMSVMYTVILLLTAKQWRKILRRYSWIKTFGIATLLWVPTEFLFFFMTKERTFMYVPLMVVQNVMAVGLNLSYANILYMNLPEEDSTAHIAFNAIGCNVFAFLGLLTGTFVTSFTGDNTIHILGMDAYAVQFTTVLRGVFMTVLGIILVTKWRAFTRDEDIAEIEAMSRLKA